MWRRLLKGFACCLHSGCENAARPLFLSGQIKDTFHPSGDEIKHTRGARWLASSGPGSPALPLHWAGAAFPSCPAAIAAPGHGHGVPQGSPPCRVWPRAPLRDGRGQAEPSRDRGRDSPGRGTAPVPRGRGGSVLLLTERAGEGAQHTSGQENTTLFAPLLTIPSRFAFF